MTTTFADSSLTTHSVTGLKTVLVEFVLIAGAAIFWVAALPFVAVSLAGVKLWDIMKRVSSGPPNPLILRRGLAQSTLTARRSTHAARA
ncbi:MAG: hypothetical protein M3Q46_07855 [Verrucomicrobiota bacterium]|nr:hypothetical protein [Verrucomicrobiota bacterium]